jgi:UDP-glucose:glycoprotein glucosyltransferase
MQFLNDLEKDAAYRKWPTTLVNLLQPMTPNQLPALARNIYTLILAGSPVDPEFLELARSSLELLEDRTPVRLGVLVCTSAGQELLHAAALDFNATDGLHKDARGTPAPCAG